jgi:hypothetical protein
VTKPVGEIDGGAHGRLRESIHHSLDGLLECQMAIVDDDGTFRDD